MIGCQTFPSFTIRDRHGETRRLDVLCRSISIFTRALLARRCLYLPRSSLTLASFLNSSLTTNNRKRFFFSQITLINKTVPTEPLAPLGRALMERHGKFVIRAVLSGVAGVAPTSTTQNLVELLTTMNSRVFEGCKMWIPEVIFAVCSPLSKIPLSILMSS